MLRLLLSVWEWAASVETEIVSARIKIWFPPENRLICVMVSPFLSSQQFSPLSATNPPLRQAVFALEEASPACGRSGWQWIKQKVNWSSQEKSNWNASCGSWEVFQLFIFPGFPLSPLLLTLHRSFFILKSLSRPDHHPGLHLHTSIARWGFYLCIPKALQNQTHPLLFLFLSICVCMFHFFSLVLGDPFQSKYSFFSVHESWSAFASLIIIVFPPVSLFCLSDIPVGWMFDLLGHSSISLNLHIFHLFVFLLWVLGNFINFFFYIKKLIFNYVHSIIQSINWIFKNLDNYFPFLKYFVIPWLLLFHSSLFLFYGCNILLHLSEYMNWKKIYIYFL